MNTIEQAREVVKRLHDDGDSITKSEVAGIIDVLILEVETFHEANKKLRAELDALKSQEPVAWQRIDPETNERVWDEDSFSSHPNDLDDCIPLYRAAGAQPMPTLASIKNAAKVAGLEFDRFSYEGTNQLVDFVAMLAAAKEQS